MDETALNDMNQRARDRASPAPAFPAHLRQKVILLSLLLHVLFFLLWENASSLGLFSPAPPAVLQSEPIVLDLQPPAREMPKEVIETPRDAQVPQPPPRADFLSDRDARARNPEADASVPQEDEPFSPGELETHSLPPSPPIAPDRPSPKEPENKSYQSLLNTERIVRETFRKQLHEEASDPSSIERSGVPHRNLSERVKDMGGLSFNTYNWEFAPYMLRLKALIEQNIYPPHAFTRLGLISGVTLLRFKIYPDGELRDLEVLDAEGHRSLMETSTEAVRLSAPFPNLPKNFPEPYLEVTGKFMYLIRNQQ